MGFIALIIILVLIILGAGAGTMCVSLYNLGVEVQKEERAALVKIIAEHNAMLRKGEPDEARWRYWSPGLQERRSEAWLEELGPAAKAAKFTVSKHEESTDSEGVTRVELTVETESPKARVCYTFLKEQELGEEPTFLLWDIRVDP